MSTKNKKRSILTRRAIDESTQLEGSNLGSRQDKDGNWSYGPLDNIELFTYDDEGNGYSVFRVTFAATFDKGEIVLDQTKPQSIYYFRQEIVDDNNDIVAPESTDEPA